MCNVYSGSSSYYQNIRIYNNTLYKSSTGMQLLVFAEPTFNSIYSTAFHTKVCHDTNEYID